MDAAHETALRNERDSLVNSPDRRAKFRRLNEIDDQLEAAGFKVDRVQVPDDYSDAADRTPRERAVNRRAKES